jgi:hypothetical protein
MLAGSDYRIGFFYDQFYQRRILMSVSQKAKKFVLIPEHNFWRALGIRLNDSLLQANKRCSGDLRFTKKILKSLPGIDVEKTLTSFQ